MLLTGRLARLARRWLAGLVLFILLAGASIAIALKVTPQQTITVAGQVSTSGQLNTVTPAAVAARNAAGSSSASGFRVRMN